MSEAGALIAENGEKAALLISPVEADHNTLQRFFEQHGWKLHAAKSFESALPLLREHAVSVVITERDLAGANWKDVLNAMHGLHEPPLLIVISRLADDSLWAEALNLGVYDVLAKPLVPEEVIRVLTSALIQRLSQQMHKAHTAYKKAAADYNTIKAKYGDMLDSVDGTFALRRAAENERRASQKYREAVQAYSAMARGNRPPRPPLETES
jgi:DNA-binding response OmpR family regulator